MPKLVEGFADRLRLPAGARDVQVFDDDLPGFGIRKFESGKASYFVKYGIGHQQRRLTLGRVVRGNLKAMRLEASKVLAKARLGTDAVAVKRAAAHKLTATLGELVARYLEDRQPKLRPRYHIEIKRQLERDWKPLQGMPVEAAKWPLVPPRSSQRCRFTSPTAYVYESPADCPQRFSKPRPRRQSGKE